MAATRPRRNLTKVVASFQQTPVVRYLATTHTVVQQVYLPGAAVLHGCQKWSANARQLPQSVLHLEANSRLRQTARSSSTSRAAIGPLPGVEVRALVAHAPTVHMFARLFVLERRRAHRACATAQSRPSFRPWWLLLPLSTRAMWPRRDKPTSR